MEDLSSILKNSAPAEPKQVSALKQYARDTHGITIMVKSTPKSYMIKVPNGALAHKFRVATTDIMRICALDKRLVIHIGS